MRKFLLFTFVALGVTTAWAQDEPIPDETPADPPIQIIFAPPDLTGRFVMGIFDAGGKLVRTLVPDRDATVFDVGLNGYITSWDGKDDAGARCPAGEYSASGYVVGDAVHVEGEAFYFNDWVAEDGVRATTVWLAQWDGAPGFKVEVAGESMPRFATLNDEGKLTWDASAPPEQKQARSEKPQFPAEPLFWTPGRDGTSWAILADGDQRVVSQFSATGESLRELRVPAGEPQPDEVLPSPTGNAILLKETSASGAQRVRLLRREEAGAADEVEGQKVVDWEIVFERTIEPCTSFGLVGGTVVADAGAHAQTDQVTVKLIPSALDAEPQSLTLKAVCGAVGTYLAAADGLQLLPVSEVGAWTRVVLEAGDKPGTVRLAQGDGVVVEAFEINHLDQIAPFDCGTFKLAAAPGETKP